MRFLFLIILPVFLAACEKGGRGLGKDSGAHGEEAYAITEKILSFGPRPPESEALANVRRYVTEELEKANWDVQEQTFKRKTFVGEKQFTNLIARYRSEAGNDLWQKPVAGVLCAHIDSKLIPGKEFLGADDAASSCAAIVQMARVLHETDPKSAAQLELVFFDGEEAFAENLSLQKRYGLYGSWAYAARWRLQDGPLPKFGLLLDMVGHKDLKIALPSDSPRELAKSLLASAAAEGGADIVKMGTVAILDDHVPLNLAGIPTVDMIGDFSSTDWWHTEKDNLDIISAKSLDFSIRVALRFLEEQLEVRGLEAQSE